jgi:hypothetical protein
VVENRRATSLRLVLITGGSGTEKRALGRTELPDPFVKLHERRPNNPCHYAPVRQLPHISATGVQVNGITDGPAEERAFNVAMPHGNWCAAPLSFAGKTRLAPRAGTVGVDA